MDVAVNKKIKWVLLVSSFAAFAVGMSFWENDAYDKGRAALQDGKYDNAINDLTTYLNLTPHGPSVPHALQLRALAYLYKRNFDKAFVDADQAIKLENDKANAEAYIYRAEANFGLGKYQDAVKDSTAAIKLNPKFVLAYNDRAAAYLMLNKAQDAVADNRTVIELQPDKPDPYYRLAQSLTAQQKYSDAMDALNKAISYGSNTDLLARRGALWFYQGEYGKAEADLNRVIAHDGGNVAAKTFLGRCELAQSDYERAIANFTAVIAKVHRGAPYYWRAKAYRLSGKTDLALADEKKLKEYSYVPTDLDQIGVPKNKK